MAYKESDLTCDWCLTPIDASESVVCKTCVETMEEKIKDLEVENATLKDRLIALGEDI